MSKQAKIGYFGTKLSEHMIRTPEDCLICVGATIARTGFQDYLGKDLIDTEADELLENGIDKEAIYRVYRSPDDVFSKETIDSFQGKTFTLTHPDKLLTVESIADYDCGHVMNVRKAEETLPDGNFALLADIMVTDKDVIEKILNGLRELSCGYKYHIKLIGNNLAQCDIIGNHVALVENARAGKYASIIDSAIPYEGFRRWIANSSIDDIVNAIF